jgi:hypothetical protein
MFLYVRAIQLTTIKDVEALSIVAMVVSCYNGKWMITSENGCCVQCMGHMAFTGCTGKSMVAIEVAVCYKKVNGCYGPLWLLCIFYCC